MKNKYIEALLSEIQHLESKVTALKDNQTVSFSFFKEAFKQTQEITRLLHNLEFVQIEDMKSQMEKLVQFLSQASDQTDSSEVEKEENFVNKDFDKLEIESVQDIQEAISPEEIHSSSKNITALEIKEDYPQLNKSESKVNENREEILRENSMFQDRKPHEEVPSPSTDMPRVEIKEDFPLQEKGTSEIKIQESSLAPKNQQTHGFVKEGATNDSKMPPIIPTTKSLNDVQPTNHTLLDTKRSISLNDRFLFQRELFDNDRYAMNNMMIKMQAFTTFAECKDYLENNTDWDFKDETVEKFLDLLKEGF